MNPSKKANAIKNLFYKELRLCINPATYFFMLTSLLLLVPSYPYFVGMCYCVFALLTSFNTAKANNDHLFSACLPIKRNEIVLAKHMDVVFTELLQVLVSVPCALISIFVIYPAIGISENAVGIDANLAFFGFTFLGYALFNLVFLSEYFRTGYKAGFPLILGIIAFVATVLIIELLNAFLPDVHAVIDGFAPEMLHYRIAIFFVGILLYIASLFASYRISLKRFEKVSL